MYLFSVMTTNPCCMGRLSIGAVQYILLVTLYTHKILREPLKEF
jgi:hypothetical protein